MTLAADADAVIDVVAVRQRVDPGVLAEVVSAEAARLGVRADVTWVDRPGGLVERVETSRAQGRSVLALTSPECGPLTGLGPGPDVVRMDLGLAEADRSAGLSAHLQGRGVDGVVWGLRALVHRGRWPVTTVPYGDHPEQVAHLRLPDAAAASVPVVVLLHGGFWRAKWALDLMDALAVDLARRGFASWNVEYRRANEHGWSAMAGDVEAAVAHLPSLGRSELDLDRIVLVGHSAGGQLAVQAAAGLGARPDAPGPALVVQVAGVADVEEAWRRDLGDGAVRDALGGRSPDGRASWAGSPMDLLPLGVRQVVVIGACDSADLREMGRRYAAAARAAGDQVDLAEEPGDHFDLIDPRSAAWSRTVELIEQVTGPVSVGPSDDER